MRFCSLVQFIFIVAEIRGLPLQGLKQNLRSTIIRLCYLINCYKTSVESLRLVLNLRAKFSFSCLNKVSYVCRISSFSFVYSNIVSCEYCDTLQ